MASKELKDRVLEACNQNYRTYNREQLSDEIMRLLKIKMDHEENKKAEAKSYNDLIGEAEIKIQYCVERTDCLQHEEAVAIHLDENTTSN